MSVINNGIVAEKSILDKFDRQTYLGNSFTNPTVSSTIGSSETPAYLIVNPAGSGKIMFFNMIGVSGGSPIEHRIYFNPTITSTGSATMPVNFRPGQNTASAMQLYNSPTLSSFGTLVTLVSSENYQMYQHDLLVIIDPGNSVCVTSNGDSAAVSYNQCKWYELGTKNN